MKKTYRKVVTIIKYVVITHALKYLVHTAHPITILTIILPKKLYTQSHAHTDFHSKTH